MEPQRHPEIVRALILAGQGDEKQALTILEQLADTGEPDALFTLGDAYWRGVLVAKDQRRAAELFGRASDAGHPMGIRGYTNLLANGRGRERRWGESLRRLRDEAHSDGFRAKMLHLLDAMDLDGEGNPIRVPAPEPLSERPEVTIFQNAFTPQECDFLRFVAEPGYERSNVVVSDQSVQHHGRTSDGATVHWLIEDPATHALNRRLAALSATHVDQGEPLYILRYRPGQEYRPHGDWLPGSNPRILTALIYLNDDYGGGETAFVETGLRVKGRKGDVLLFRNQGPDGRIDTLSLHAGLPVTYGTKYIGSRWIRAHRHIGGGERDAD